LIVKLLATPPGGIIIPIDMSSYWSVEKPVESGSIYSSRRSKKLVHSKELVKRGATFKRLELADEIDVLLLFSGILELYISTLQRHRRP